MAVLRHPLPYQVVVASPRAIGLTANGRRVSLSWTALVQVFQDGTDLFVVAANGGPTRPPGWYFNLIPEMRVVGKPEGRRLRLRAEGLPTVEGGGAGAIDVRAAKEGAAAAEGAERQNAGPLFDPTPQIDSTRARSASCVEPRIPQAAAFPR